MGMVDGLSGLAVGVNSSGLAVSLAFGGRPDVGPGFGEVGSMDNFSALPGVFKLSNSLLMLLGRLEIFGFIQLFFIKWWR